MSMNYTTNEKQIINRAWDLIVYECAKHSTFAYSAKQALKIDKPERCNITQSKAILIESFVDGQDNPEKPISELNWISKGCIQMLILGAAFASRFPDDFTNEDKGVLIAAIYTQEQALKRNITN